MNDKYIIGVEAGGTKVAYGLFDGGGALAARAQHATDAAADGLAFSDALIRNIRSLMDAGGVTFDMLEGIGICMPSFILFDEGRILMTSAIPNIKDFPMRDYLAERLPARIALDNDANAAAVAEHRRGAGRGARHMVYMVVGTGLGCGIIIDGRLFRGSYGWAGECGHMLATPDAGIMCGCENRGCYMSYVAGKSLPERIKSKLAGDGAGGFTSGVSGGMADGALSESSAAVGNATTDESKSADGRALLNAYNGGDARAVGVINEMAHYLAVCVYNVYQMMNINTYVFGGGLVNLGEALFGRMRAEFARFDHIRMPVYFKMAELTEDAGIIGAAEFVRE